MRLGMHDHLCLCDARATEPGRLSIRPNCISDPWSAGAARQDRRTQRTMSGAFDLDQSLPWGRNRAEYLAFFDLLDLARLFYPTR